MPRSDKKRKEEKAVSLKDKNAERPELGRRKFIFVFDDDDEGLGQDLISRRRRRKQKV